MSAANALETIDDSDKRMQLSEHIEVLDKVKIIPYFPKELFVGISHASNYYGSTISTIQSILKRHEDEFLKDGVKKISGEELKKYQNLVVEEKLIDDNGDLFIGSKTRYYTIIPKRALLRIGMLLKKSPVAKEVRQYLLELEDSATKEQKESAAQKAGEDYISSLKNLEEGYKKDLLKYNYDKKLIEDKMIHGMKRCNILGLNNKDSALLVQEAIVENKDINVKILEKLKHNLTSENEKNKGILFQKINYMAKNYFNDNYGYACKQICEKLKYKIGKDLYKEYYSVKNKNLAHPLTYADLFIKFNAYEEASAIINEIMDEIDEQDELKAKEIEVPVPVKVESKKKDENVKKNEENKKNIIPDWAPF